MLWAVGIQARLLYLQVHKHEALQSRAENQSARTMDISAKRGDILDRRGRVLAYSVDADSVYGVPSEIENAEKVASILCGALTDCAPKEQEALAVRLRQKRAFVYVRRRVTPPQARRLAALNLEGIGFIKEDRRFYPKKQLAAQLLGFVGVDNRGLAGIEAAYDSQISGALGKLLYQTDARGRAFSRLERPPTTGATVELTIDEYLQHIAERELRDAVVRNRAAGGTVLIMAPKTGEILALANEPTFNPNSFSSASPEHRRNRAVQDIYEPGSTFKVVTASAAIEERVIGVDDLIDVAGGRIRFGSRVIHDTHDYGALSFTDVMVKSSNVGAIKVGLRLGPERLGMYVRRFGFGRALSPDFPGETTGIVWDPRKLDNSALASDLDGLSDWRHSAADGGGCQLGCQRRRSDAAPRRAGARPRWKACRGEAGRSRPDDLQGHGRHADLRSWSKSSSAEPPRTRRSRVTPSQARPERHRSSSTAVTRTGTITPRLSDSSRRETRSRPSSSSSIRRMRMGTTADRLPVPCSNALRRRRFGILAYPRR